MLDFRVNKVLHHCLFLSIICSKSLIEFKICYVLEAVFNLPGKQIDNKRLERGLGSLFDKKINNIQVFRNDLQ